MAYEFTDEDRAKSAETRKRKREAAPTDDELAQKGFRWLLEVWSGEIDAETGERFRAARLAIPILYPRLRAQEPEQDGDTPINVNERMEQDVANEHGNPWEGDDGRPDGKTTGE